MVIVKMKTSGFYNNVSFVRGQVVEFTEEVLKGLDPRDYDVVMTAKDIEAKAKADAKAKAKAEADAAKAAEEAEEARFAAEKEAAEKAAKGGDNKMQTPNKTK